MPATPEFVRWTLAYRCALRDDTDVTSPEATERQLRSLRGYSDAVHEGRILDGVCFERTAGAPPALGFPAAEVLAAYGGETFVQSQCPACPANLLRGREHSGLAGCFGMFPLGTERGKAWDAALDLAPIDAAATFLPTAPRWYGLWTVSPVTAATLAAFQRILKALALEPAEREFAAAVGLAIEHALPLHVQLFPAGRYDAQAWQIDAHCPRCKAPMSERERRCAVCHFTGRAEPPRQRKPRGQRPYVPLERFLGPRGAAAFLARLSSP